MTTKLGTEHKIIVGHPSLPRLGQAWRNAVHKDILYTVGKHFDGFTAWQATGDWKGKREDCTVILVATDDVLTLRRCARELARTFNQTCVYVSSEGVGRLVYP